MPSAKDILIGRITGIAERVGASEGIEVVEVRLAGAGRGRLLRIYIDRPGGVSHADCETMSRQVGTILDVEDVMPGGAYTLEVSSPGVERPLKTPRDFERHRGEKVTVLLREAAEGQRRWEGRLAGIEGDAITLEVAAGRQLRFGLGQIERANLKFEW